MIGGENFIVQRPGSNSSARKLAIDKCGAYKLGEKHLKVCFPSFVTRSSVLLSKVYQVTYVAGAQIVNNPCI